MKKHIDLTVPITFNKIKEYQVSDSRFIQCKIFLMHLGNNLNGSYFSKEAVEKAMPTLANTPILAYIEENNDGENDFSDHRIELEKKDGQIKLHYKGKAIGVIPETNDAHFEMRVCDDNIKREFLVCNGLLWTKFDDSAEIFERDSNKQESMELDDNYTGHFNEDGYFEFDTFKFYGACALGEDVSPAMRSASIDTVFTMNEIKNKLEQFTNYIQNHSSDNTDVDIKDFEEGGISNLDEKLEVLKRFNVTVETLDFSIDELSLEELENKLNVKFSNSTNEPEQTEPVLFSATMTQKREALRNALDNNVVKDENNEIVEETCFWVEDFDDTYVYVEKSHWTKDGDYEDKYGRFTYSFDTENLTAIVTGEFEEMVKVWLTIEEKNQIDQERANYSTLSAEFEGYKNNYSKTNADVEVLENFMKTTLEKQRESDVADIFERFEKQLSDNPDFIDLKFHCDDLSISQIEDKCFCIVGKVTTKFSTKEKKDSSVKLPLGNENNDDVNDPYGGLLAKVYQK